LPELEPKSGFGAAVAIGNFDGVHRGHRAVIDRARQHARKLNAALGVITFEPHPRELLQGAQAPSRLSPLRRKLELLRSIGVDQVHVLPFTRSLMEISAQSFVEDILIGRLGVRAVITGDNFRFGYKRRGDVDLMRRIGSGLGVIVDTAPAVEENGQVISSTRIRETLLAGRVAEAALLLGYGYEISGRVRPGDRRGRTLGFPTANTYPLGRRTAMPGKGIYAVRTAIEEDDDGRWHPAAASIGTNPTFDGRETRLEVHLLDGMDYDLYGRRLRVSFIDWLRDEERYETVDALTAQIRIDCDRALALTLPGQT